MEDSQSTPSQDAGFHLNSSNVSTVTLIVTTVHLVLCVVYVVYLLIIRYVFAKIIPLLLTLQC